MSAQRIMNVTEIHFERQKSNPVQYLVWAEGKVPSLAWTGGRLDARMYIRPPEDGIQDFDFVATPPSKPSGTAIAPIESAKLQLPDDGWIRGFRVHAVQNSLETAWGAPKGGTTMVTASPQSGPAGIRRTYEDRAPMVLTGVLQRSAASFCMDGATHLLLHGMGGTRLKARNQESEDALKANEDGKTRVVVAGHPAWGAECMHLAVYQVMPAVEFMTPADERFVPFPMRMVPERT